MSPGFTTRAAAALPEAKVPWHEPRLDREPARSRFLLGPKLQRRDAACFTAWFLRNDPESFPRRREPALQRWFDRVDAMGHGQMSPRFAGSIGDRAAELR